MEIINDLLGKTFTCARCGRQHTIPTRIIEQGPSAFSRLPSVLKRLTEGNKVFLLADEITFGIAGRSVEEVVCKAGFQVTPYIIRPRGTAIVHAETVYIPPIAGAAKGTDIVVTVGAGTVTDLGKCAAFSLNVPAVCIPTAPSMNAYTSPVSALMRDGLKVAAPVAPPAAVVMDPGILTSAPMEMVRAGFADSLAKTFANADWKIASLLTGDYYCSLPCEIVTAVEKTYVTKGAMIGGRDAAAIMQLMEGLLVGGFSMVIAGNSSPASGGEHLISHCLDMYAHRLGREPFSLHGTQVGISMLIAARIYERLARLEEKDLLKERRRLTPGEHCRMIGRFFPGIEEIVMKEFEQKAPILADLPGRFASCRRRINEEVFPLLHDERKIKGYLESVGCPIRYADIGVTADIAREAVRAARYIRGRITVLDLAAETGILDEIADEVS